MGSWGRASKRYTHRMERIIAKREVPDLLLEYEEMIEEREQRSCEYE